MRHERGGTGRQAMRLWMATLALWGAGCGGEVPGPTPVEPPGLPGPTSPAPELPEPTPPKQAPEPSPPPRDSPERPTPPSVEPWGHQLGGPQDDRGTGVAVDAEGHVSWVWSSTPREDGERQPVEGQRRALMLSRYTGAGEHEWTREFPRVRVSEPRVGASGDGAVYLGGNAFLHAVDFGLGAAEDGFLVRFSSAGQPEWQRRVGQKLHGLAVGARGEVLVSGQEWMEGRYEPLLTLHASDGAVRWTRRFQEAEEGTGLERVALEPSGRAVLAGTLVGVLRVDDQRLGTEGTRSLAVLVFEPDGSLAWGQVLTGVDSRVTDVAARADGSVVLAGESQGAMSWGGTTLADGGPFLLAMDAQGRGWLRKPGCEALGFVPVLAVGGLGEVEAACGSTLSSFAPEGTPRGERQLQPESCESGACTLDVTAMTAGARGGWLVTGHQRDGVTTETWNQDAFLRLIAP
ncbi:hypothetical protein [Hyalangium gracile]|uniref:hypothetical protein n=1 Tax=Hyalangium gracile TaxID=394092 RepID=UPI001CCA0384|nr:hypothetical protein [Hyalangium gracile]